MTNTKHRTLRLEIDERCEGYSALLQEALRHPFISLGPTAFCLQDDMLEIHGVTTVRLKNKIETTQDGVVGLTLVGLRRTSSVQTTLILNELRKGPTAKSKRRLKRPTHNGPRLHSDAAAFVTGSVKGSTVRGGLPTLGKRR